jgi:hypothetical protein
MFAVKNSMNRVTASSPAPETIVGRAKEGARVPTEPETGTDSLKHVNFDSVARKSGYSCEQFATAGRISW